jgi:hypothetical protein
MPEQIQRELDWMVESGYYYRDEEREILRPTWSGVLARSFKILWPAKPIRGMLGRRRAARLLRELGLDHPIIS